MKSLTILFACGGLFGGACTGATTAEAAEIYGGHYRAPLVRLAQPREAPVAVITRAPCPDRYSCYSLYGGYRMPYGSPEYWTRYTMSGWSAY
jgi:hypothetical protein